MYVCCCNAVTDREVADAIDSGARTRAEVTRACGAGGDCGACHATIEAMISGSDASSAARKVPSCGVLREHAVASDAAHGGGGAKPEEAVETLLPAAALVRERAA